MMAGDSDSVARKICKEIPNSVLDECVHIYFLDEIASELVEWEVLAPEILTRSEQREIEEDYARHYGLQKREALRKWRKKNKSMATIRSLVRILCKHKLVDIAEIVAAKCQKVPVGPISVFAGHLREFYINKFSHPLTEQWPGLHKHFDLPTVYVDLKLHKVSTEKSITMQEVCLSDVFQSSSSRLVILFEGVAGSGKTTLSWYACQEWANEKLLQQFRLLIHVKIAKLQHARALCDLIPDPDKEARDELAQAIVDSRGKGVCLLLEGTDEASNDLWEYILSGLLHNNELSQLSYIITSRPDGRLFKLQRLLSSKIVIDGFTYQTLNEFLVSAVPSDRFEEAKLVVEKSPQLQTLCTLPINAVVVSFLVQCYKNEIPITQTELFNLLFCHICIRHMQSRTKGGKPKKVQQLPDDLPSDLKPLFGKLCKLAHTALQEKKKEFSIGDPKLVDFQDEVKDKLGILQLHQNFTMFGMDEYYSFPHLALQQFLAAIHVSQQADPVQVSFIEGIIRQDPLDEVLPFHAGRTSNKVRTKIVEQLHCRMSLHHRSIASTLQHNPTLSSDPRRRTLALCKCLYECHEESLLAKVELQMESVSGDPGIDIRYVISFQNMWMSPLECLAVGYFARYKSITMPKRSSLYLHLGRCAISDTSVSVLTKELRRDVNYRTPGRIILTLTENNLNKTSLLSIKELLKGQSNIEGLGVQKCFLSLDKTIFLKHMIEGLSSNASCLSTAIGYNGLNRSHVYHLVLLIHFCKQLRIINLPSCSFRGIMPLMSRAFRISNLVSLQLNNCDIDDEMLVSLANEISQSPHLIQIELYNNPFTPYGLCSFVSHFSNDVSTLKMILVDPILCVPFRIPGPCHHALQRVNKFRRQQCRPELNLSPATPSQLQDAKSTLYLNSLNEPTLSRKSDYGSGR